MRYALDQAVGKQLFFQAWYFPSLSLTWYDWYGSAVFS